MRILIDVDGVVADLMKGFDLWMRARHGVSLGVENMVTHRISLSPNHRELHAALDLDIMLRDFLSTPNVYQDWVEPIDHACTAITTLRAKGHELGFVTATLHSAPSSYGSKLRWLNDTFGRIPMLCVQSGEKHWVSGDYAIDDRYDTCERWRASGVTPLLFRQTWNEAPPGTKAYDWKEILDELG